MADRVPAMVEHLVRDLVTMRGRKRRPGTNAAADLKASLLRRWPDMSDLEFMAATMGLGEQLARAETAARPANSNKRGRS